MDFWKTIVGLAKRRYVGPPVLVLSIVVAAIGFMLVPTRYSSSATMVLTTPPSGGVLSQDPNRPTGLTNPLLQFGEGLKTTAGILIQVMNTPESLNQIGAATDSGTSVVVDNGSSNPSLLGVEGPFVYIQAESTTAEEAHNVVLRAQQGARDELLARQKALNAPPSTYILMTDVVSASVPEAKLGGKWRAAGIGLVAAILFGLGGAYAAQRLLTVRQRREDDEPRSEPAEAAEPASAEPPTVKFTPVATPAAPAPDLFAPAQTGAVAHQPQATANGNGTEPAQPKEARA